MATREREGARLAALIVERCDRLQTAWPRCGSGCPRSWTGCAGACATAWRNSAASWTPTGLEQELALLAARLDVDEEMDRLEAHVAEVRSVVSGNEPVGRRLDFLMQELNREANTLGSKSADVAVTREGVEMKVLIEQMREQIQNLE